MIYSGSSPCVVSSQPFFYESFQKIPWSTLIWNRNSSRPIQERVKKTSNYEGKIEEWQDDDDYENKVKELNQNVSENMTRMLKKSSRTRPELGKALDSVESRS